MAEPQSMTCARSQKLQRALGSGCAGAETLVPIKPNRTGQLEWASCFYLDRPMTNSRGVFIGRKLADATEAATLGDGTTTTRTAVIAARKRLITTRRPQARWQADVRETGPLR